MFFCVCRLLLLLSLFVYFLVREQVRVYQARNDSRMSMGCDIPSHPSKLWIEAHKYRYMRMVSEKEVSVALSTC